MPLWCPPGAECLTPPGAARPYQWCTHRNVQQVYARYLNAGQHPEKIPQLYRLGSCQGSAWTTQKPITAPRHSPQFYSLSSTPPSPVKKPLAANPCIAIGALGPYLFLACFLCIIHALLVFVTISRLLASTEIKPQVPPLHPVITPLTSIYIPFSVSPLALCFLSPIHQLLGLHSSSLTSLCITTQSQSAIMVCYLSPINLRAHATCRGRSAQHLQCLEI